MQNTQKFSKDLNIRKILNNDNEMKKRLIALNLLLISKLNFKNKIK